MAQPRAVLRGGHGVVKSLMQMLGLDNRRDAYRYTRDETLGYTSARREAERWVKTTCGYCSVGCGMELGVRGNEIVAVRGEDAHPVSLGKLCPKGLAEHQPLSAPNRAKYPLLRGERVTWPVALKAMVDEFRAMRPEEMAVISTGQLPTEEFYAQGKLVRLGFGTPNYDSNTTLCMASAVAGYKRSFGSDGPPGLYEDFRLADVILLIGANVADNHPILVQHLDANRRKTLIAVDPRVTKTTMLADFHLALKPRTDVALLNAIGHVLIRDGLVNAAYVARHTNGYADLAAQLDAWTPERAAGITGLSAAQIETVARLYGEAKSAMIAWTMGVNHSTQGVETVNAINNLALITGKIGKPGSAPMSITGQCNAMGTRECGASRGLPGHRKFESAEDRAEMAALWNVAEERIPRAAGPGYPDIIDACVRGEIKMLWIIGTNPLVSYPNQRRLVEALDRVPFLVVQDGFHPTPTSERAQLVLPAAIWGEKDGSYTNSERRVGYCHKAVDAPGEAKSDFEIFLALAEELRCREELFGGWNTVDDARREMAWVCTSHAAASDDPARLYRDGEFATADGRANLIPVEWVPFTDQPNGEFPFTLNTGRTVEHWHTRTKTAHAGVLEAMAPEAWLDMNPADAGAWRTGDRVDIRSRRGTVRDVALRVTQTVAPGQLFMPFHFAEANVNEVTHDEFDPISREPNYKQCAVRVDLARPHRGDKK